MKFPYVVVLDNVRSALNVGAIFRTCDGAGASKLYLCGITPYPPHNKIPKTALGAIDYVEWERAGSTAEVIAKLKDEGYKCVGVEQTENSKLFNEVEYSEKIALVFGHEITGVSTEVLNMCDEKVIVPMYGRKESLNVATTVGIVCYEVATQLEKLI
jgi:tRNA G18 (ribose-2'-O)-methylase SpoU